MKMESNDKLKEVDIKNCTCYYFSDITKIEDEESYKNIFVYNISYKNLIAKPLRIIFDEIDGFIRVYAVTR